MAEIQDSTTADPSPEKATSSPRLPSVATLRQWLPFYLNNTDRTIEHLAKVLSTPSGTDTLLSTLCYTSLLSSTVLSSISLHRLRNAVQQLIEKALSLPPNTTVIIDTSAIPTSRLLITAKRLKALSSLISDYRMFARLWGQIGIWKWGKRALQNPSEDAVVRRITYAQVFVNILYQYLENGAYLSSKGILGWSSEKQTKAWLWSSRFWMAHVSLDFIRLYHEYTVRKTKGATEEKTSNEDEVAEWTAKWRREMLVNLAFAPLTVHWSLEQGLVGDFWVGVLGGVAGVTGLRELWKNTKE